MNIESKQLDKCLRVMKSSKTDNDVLAALLLVTKVVKADQCDSQTRRNIFDAIGFQFLSRLMRTTTPPEGCSPNAFKSLAVTILSCFCSDTELVTHPDMLRLVPYFNEIIISVTGNNTMDDGEAGGGDVNGVSEEDAHMVDDSYECLVCIANQKLGREHILKHHTATALCQAYAEGCYGCQKGFTFLRFLLSSCGSRTWDGNANGRRQLTQKLVKEFQTATDMKKYDLCSTLCSILVTMDKEQVSTLDHTAWGVQVREELLHILQNKLGQSQRDPALKLSSAMVDLLGVEWCLGNDGSDRKFVLILSHLTCIEVRMILEDLMFEQIIEKADLLSSCFSMLENLIGYLTSAPSMCLDERQVKQLHAAMLGAFSAVIYFITKNQLSEMVEHPIMIACVRVLGSWIAEETSALKEEIINLLPFLVQVSTSTFHQLQAAEEATVNGESVAMDTSEPASSLVDDEPNVTESRATDEESRVTDDRIVDQKTRPLTDVLKFLLPGLCHLSAETKPRAILKQLDIHTLLGEYFNYQWKKFQINGNRETEVTLTTLCGIFLNLTVLEVELVTTHLVFKELLQFILTSGLPKLAYEDNHIVLAFNFLVIGLMLLRHQAGNKDVNQSDCDRFMTCAIRLFSRAHCRDGKPGKMQLVIAESYQADWDQLAELWFLGMQAFCTCIDLYSWLSVSVLKTGWIPNLIKLLLDAQGRKVDPETTSTYQSLLCELVKHNPQAKHIVLEKGGREVARLYQMKELSSVLGR